MIGLGRVSQVLAVRAVIQAQGSQPQTLDAWERFRSLAAPPVAEQTHELKEELFACVRSLFPDDGGWGEKVSGRISVLRRSVPAHGVLNLESGHFCVAVLEESS